MLQEQNAFLYDVSLTLNRIWQAGALAQGRELWRTPEQQSWYLQTGKSKTMLSSHLDALAIDINIWVDNVLLVPTKSASGILTFPPILLDVGEYWESLNEKNRWGGSWRGLIKSGKSTFVDVPHFERKVK